MIGVPKFFVNASLLLSVYIIFSLNNNYGVLYFIHIVYETKKRDSLQKYQLNREKNI